MVEPLPEYRDDPLAYELEERSRPDEMTMLTCAGFIASRWLDQFKNASCLDLCCGTGLSMEWLVNHCNVEQVVGVDSCKSYLEFAAHACATSRVTPKLVCGDALEVPLPHTRFDLIMLASAYHHIEDHRKVLFLTRVRHLLSARGRAVMAENVLPSYAQDVRNRRDYQRAVRQFYDAVLKTARDSNPNLPRYVELLIERVAKHGFDGDYEYKVSWPILMNDLRESGFVVEFHKRVWPLADSYLPGEAGNYVLLLRAAEQ